MSEDAMPPTPEIKGWCPGAYAPMASNDGLLIRAKTIGSRISAAQLSAVAAISEDCGNGFVDLSQRAQLQIRGLREATLCEALPRLEAAGLLPRSAEAERVTNIVAAPLAGLDGGAAFDANAMARALAEAIEADETLRALPAKFLFAIDDGSALQLTDVEADISICATHSDYVEIRIAGADNLVVVTEPPGAINAALKLARAFVALRDGAFELRRMKRLVVALGAGRVLDKAGLAGAPAARPPKAPPPRLLGARQTDRLFFAGAAAPFGRWRAHDLAQLAELAEAKGKGEARLTPWRAVLIPAENADAAQRILDAARALNLIASHDDPRLCVAACPGAPECPQAKGETRGALARLAPLAQKLAGDDGVGLHISGCAKGCARPKSAPVTLIANDGRFDLVEQGRACDAPQLAGLDIDAVEQMLVSRAKEHPCPTH
jgi:precorrin-3B synthase